ncbi:MAG: MBL fold metallo-hydrolase [Lachnospiraceae bacterium]|nr:MBL fold metallo-hydrolase [Lachnospiraceae bacterium]
MKITYIHHSCFLVETDSCYYLFDYEKGALPQMDVTKPILVLASHGHHDHYNPEIFSMLRACGMQTIYAVLSEDIPVPANVNVLQVSPGKEYDLWHQQKLTTFQSTDEGVAFLIEDMEDEEQKKIIYHAGDLNDWVWDEESDSYNEQMTLDYRKQINLLAEKLNHQEIDTAFVVLDPRQEKDYDRGLCYFLEHISVKKVYPMHYWGSPDIIGTFLQEHPEYQSQIQRTE